MSAVAAGFPLSREMVVWDAVPWIALAIPVGVILWLSRSGSIVKANAPGLSIDSSRVTIIAIGFSRNRYVKVSSGQCGLIKVTRLNTFNLCHDKQFDKITAPSARRRAAWGNQW